MKLRYVVVDDIDKEVVKSFKGFISALRFAKTLEKPYIYEYKVEGDKSFSEDDWECVWNWEDQWDEDTAVNLILNRQYKEVAKDADQIDDNHASDAFTSMIEDFELNIRKTPDKVEVSTSGDEAGEIFDFARAILGDNFEAFDQDFPDPEENKVSELAPAEFEYDFDEDDIQDDVQVDPDDAFSEVEFKGPRTEDEIADSEDSAEDAVAEPSEKSTEDSVEDDVVEPQDVVPAAEKALLDTIAETPADESPKDMIDGKLVDAKDPTEGEVEVEEEPEKDLKEALGWADMEFSSFKYDFETEHCEASVQDYEFSYKSKDCWVSFYLLRPEDEKVIYVTLTGLDASDVEIETGSDSWSDPGVYPNAVADGPLSSYSYSTVEDAKLAGKPSDLNYSFSDEQDQPITEEQAKEFLGVSEEEYQTIITKVKEAGFEAFSDIAHDWALDPDHWDTFFEDYTGTPEIRTTHLEYTDKDVTDDKAVLPDNITKSEDNHCKKINKGINHDMDPKEKALLAEGAWFPHAAKKEWAAATWDQKLEFAETILAKIIAMYDIEDYDDEESAESEIEGWAFRNYLYRRHIDNDTFDRIKATCDKYSTWHPGLTFSIEEIPFEDAFRYSAKTLYRIGYNLATDLPKLSEDISSMPLSAEAWLNTDWDTKVEIADELLEKLVDECDSTAWDYNDTDSYWDEDVLCKRYLYYQPINEFAKVEKLCDKYSRRYPGLKFYAEPFEYDVAEGDPNFDEDEFTAGEIGYHLGEVDLGEAKTSNQKGCLKESLNKVWDCIWDGEVLGQVEAETEDEAYAKMENTWPELPFGFVDGIAYVEPAENLDEFLDAKINLGADLHNFGGQNNDVDVLNTQNESVCKDGEKCVNECGDACKKKATKEDDLTELLDLDLGVNVDAHEFGGTGNKVDVLNSGLPKLEALEDEPGYDELLQYIHNRRTKKGIKAESLNTKDDMSDEEFVEAFGQELVKNNIKPKKACKGKDCKVKEDWSELYDEDGMDNYDFSDIDVVKTETTSEDNDEWDWDWDALAQDEEEKERGKEALESDNLDYDINI